MAQEKTSRELALEEKEKQRIKSEEKVTIQLFKDGNEHRGDVEVCVNGKIWQIQRGTPVVVPRSVSEVLQNSARQDIIALEKMQEAANQNLGER